VKEKRPRLAKPEALNLVELMAVASVVFRVNQARSCGPIPNTEAHLNSNSINDLQRAVEMKGTLYAHPIPIAA